MTYEGHARNLFPPLARAAGPYKTGFMDCEDVIGAILALSVTVGGGPITGVNVYVPSGRTIAPATTEEVLFYSLTPVAPISAAGVYTFTVMPGGGNCEGPVKAGYWPPRFEVEVVQGGGGSMTWELNALWIHG
jgi:hypothetical protein